MRIAISPDATKTGRLLGRGYEVLYSPQAGVVAITMTHSDKAGLVIPTFWLVGETGLGAKLDHVVGTSLADQWGGQEP